MNNQILPGGGEQHRIKRDRAVIQSGRGDISLENEEQTEISENASQVVTTTTVNSLELDGEIIQDIQSQIVGRCQEPTCSQYLTYRTFRECGNPECSKILCHRHARFHRAEGLFFCWECYKWVRIKRFFLILAWLIITPFVERVDE